MRKRTIAAAAAAIVLCFGCTACEGEPVEHVTYSTDTAIVDRYFEGIDGCDSIEFEERVISWEHFGMDISIGPHEPGYCGVLHLSDEQAAELMDKYEWQETEFPELQFENIDISDLADDTWYRSSEFDRDTFKIVHVNNVVFNGSDIVFDIHTT